MDSHIKALAVLNIAFSSMGVIAAIIVLLVMGGVAGLVSADQADPDAAAVAPFLGGLGAIVSGSILLLSLPALIGGIGLLQKAPWSRMVILIVSALHLLSIPFGTALGIYGIWVLTQPEAEALLQANRPLRMTPPPASSS
jgi:hypothetical protein